MMQTLLKDKRKMRRGSLRFTLLKLKTKVLVTLQSIGCHETTFLANFRMADYPAIVSLRPGIGSVMCCGS